MALLKNVKSFASQLEKVVKRLGQVGSMDENGMVKINGRRGLAYDFRLLVAASLVVNKVPEDKRSKDGLKALINEAINRKKVRKVKKGRKVKGSISDARKGTDGNDTDALMTFYEGHSSDGVSDRSYHGDESDRENVGPEASGSEDGRDEDGRGEDELLESENEEEGESPNGRPRTPSTPGRSCYEGEEGERPSGRPRTPSTPGRSCYEGEEGESPSGSPRIPSTPGRSSDEGEEGEQNKDPDEDSDDSFIDDSFIDDSEDEDSEEFDHGAVSNEEFERQQRDMLAAKAKAEAEAAKAKAEEARREQARLEAEAKANAEAKAKVPAKRRRVVQESSSDEEGGPSNYRPTKQAKLEAEAEALLKQARLEQARLEQARLEQARLEQQAVQKEIDLCSDSD